MSIRKYIILLYLFLCCQIFCQIQEQILLPSEIVEKAEKVLSDWQGKFEMQLTIYNENIGRSNDLDFFIKNKDMNLVVFKSPATEAGKKVLFNNNQMWMYFSNINRSVSVLPTNALVGSDFSYADIVTIDYITGYEIKLLEMDIYRDTNVYMLELTGSDSTLYSKIIYYISEDFLPIARFYYTSNDILFKMIHFKEFILYNNKLFPSLWEMDSEFVDSELTTIEVLSFEKMKLKDSFFSQIRLKF